MYSLIYAVLFRFYWLHSLPMIGNDDIHWLDLNIVPSRSATVLTIKSIEARFLECIWVHTITCRILPSFPTRCLFTEVIASWAIYGAQRWHDVPLCRVLRETRDNPKRKWVKSHRTLVGITRNYYTMARNDCYAHDIYWLMVFQYQVSDMNLLLGWLYAVLWGRNRRCILDPRYEGADRIKLGWATHVYAYVRLGAVKRFPRWLSKLVPAAVPRL